MALKNINKTNGKVYNIGGGPANSLSILELIKLLESLLGLEVSYKFSDWRQGDQKIFVSDNSRARKDFGWKPKISFRLGIKRLIKWLENNEAMIKKYYK